MFTVYNAAGRGFNVVLVREGERYGLNDALTHDRADALVEVWDRTHAGPRFGPRGQFVTRYYVSTFREIAEGNGLCLDGGVAVWVLDGSAVTQIKRYLTAEGV